VEPLTPDELLERSQWDTFWVPEDTELVDRPELRFVSSPRRNLSLNAVLRTRAEPGSEPKLVDEVRQAHRGVSRWMVNPQCRTPGLERALEQAGYRPQPHYVAYTIGVEAYVPRSSGWSVQRVESLPDLRAFWEVRDRAFGAPLDFSEEDLQDQLHKEQETGRIRRFVVRDDAGAPVCSAGMNLYPELGFVFLWGGGTVPEARGRGAYSAIVARRVQVAAEQGCSQVGIYAQHDTSAPIVAAQGFVSAGVMTHWERWD
jgi:hypothetical protein